ncbi:hypothetical protein BC834DRAFT_403651 [Gloeopeniophorella convolvens]|nr:hypothetical protein BC834DRAFT_403651 [Gloeopeniophorella convolvens]
MMSNPCLKIRKNGNIPRKGDLWRGEVGQVGGHRGSPGPYLYRWRKAAIFVEPHIAWHGPTGRWRSLLQGRNRDTRHPDTAARPIGPVLHLRHMRQSGIPGGHVWPCRIIAPFQAPRELLSRSVSLSTVSKCRLRCSLLVWHLYDGFVVTARHNCGGG